jgi:hypothetical protein
VIKRTIDNWAAWPECPQCNERRVAVCPICSTNETDFRLADYDDADGAENEADVLLLCSTCDEPFVPQFYRDCDGCEFDFGEGIERQKVVREELNNRVIFVILGVVLLLVGLGAFFTIVLRD